MPTPPPSQLTYLDSVLQKLRALPPDEVNEDMDTSELESALRERVSGLSIREAQDRLSEDRKALKAWLKEAGDANGSGQWLIAFLSYMPGATVRSLLAPPGVERAKAASHGSILMEPPVGLSAKPEEATSSLSLWKDGQQVGGIGIIKTTLLGLYRRRYDAMTQSPSPLENWAKSKVQFGECRGDKYSYSRTGPVALKTVRYVLEVPGGAVEAFYGSGPGGEDFDEAVFEEKLRTLRVIPAR